MKSYILDKTHGVRLWTIFRLEANASGKWTRTPLVIFTRRKMALRGIERVRKLNYE